jgi:hypothetical protein
VNLSTEVRRVSVAHHDGRDASYEVNLTGGFATGLKAGKDHPTGEAVGRLRAARVARAARARGRAEQRWFRNQAIDAVAELRALVGRTKGPIFAIDPYFSGEDLLRVLLVVRDPKICVDILVGAEHLRQARGPEGEEGERLAGTLSEVVASGRINPIEIRVMEGATPAIHDRFLHLDKDLWMLGSSLQAFGSRGTLLVKVPDPEPVVGDLRAVWNDSIALSIWLEKRRASRGND